jgi:hypothetical protein
LLVIKTLDPDPYSLEMLDPETWIQLIRIHNVCFFMIQFLLVGVIDARGRSLFSFLSKDRLLPPGLAVKFYEELATSLTDLKGLKSVVKLGI